MQPVSAIVVFLIIWWTVIFCVLPFGLSAQDDAGDKTFEGYRAPGAPKTLNMKKKLLITTGITIFLWAGIMGLIYSGLFDFREFALSGDADSVF